MAALTAQAVKITGTQITYSAADAAGETFPPGRAELRVRNGHTGPQSVTVVTPGSTRWGQDEPDITVSIPAGAEFGFGPFPRELADPVDRQVHVTYSGVTALTVALVTF